MLAELRQEEDARQDIQYARDLFAKGELAASRNAFEKAVALGQQKPPADEALFMLGLIEGHPNAGDRDYSKASAYMKRVSGEFRSSAYAPQALVMGSLFDTLQRMINEKQNSDAALQERQRAETELREARRLLARKQFDTALRDYQQIHKRSRETGSGEEALLMLGLAHAHPDNPKKDYPKALEYLNRLIREYPDSASAEQAKAWTATIRAIEALKSIDTRYGERKRYGR